MASPFFYLLRKRFSFFKGKDGGKMRKKIVIEEDKTSYQAGPNVISFPVTVFETAESKEELEDWLLAHDYKFIKKMKRARKNDLDDEFIPWEKVKKNLLGILFAVGRFADV